MGSEFRSLDGPSGDAGGASGGARGGADGGPQSRPLSDVGMRAAGSAREVQVFRRREQKYEVGAAAATFLRQEIARRLPCFEFEPGHPQTYVTTIYFDTRNREFYRQAERNYEDNVKIRVKEYYYAFRDTALRGEGGPATRNGQGGAARFKVSPTCYVEIKQRVAGIVVKKRFGLPKTHLVPLLRGEDVWPVLQESSSNGELDALREVYREMRRYLATYHFEITSVVTYRRTVFQECEADLRVTFDDRLSVYAPSSSLYDSFEALTVDVLGTPLRTSQRVILEIKCPGEYPDWLEKALRDHSTRRLSKFTTSVRLLLGAGGDAAESPGALSTPQSSSPEAAPPNPPASDTELMKGFFN